MNDKSTAVPVKLTKRQILSKLARTLNPVGAGATVLFKLKTAMQQLWQIGLGWDEDVPPNERIKCLPLFEKMTAFNYVKFDQYLTPPGTKGNPSLADFCDALQLASGACAYTRWKLADGKLSTRFVAAKTRVAPLKELMIPRPDLQATVLGSSLGKSILQESRFNFERVCYLTDSHVALARIKGRTPLQTLCFLHSG